MFDHLENFYISQRIHRNTQTFVYDDKQSVKTHKLLRYYSFRNT